MAHVMKSIKSQIGGLTRHFERYKNENNEYLKFGNQEIDIEKTHLNYNLADEKNQLEFIKKRISEVRCLNRKDINIMCSWVVTLPGEIKTVDDQDLFFRETYKFLEDEYKKENVISSYVHLDETTPHMHFAFVPVVRDKNKGDLKVSAKELITRKHLQEFHSKLDKHMEKVFGRDIGILNEKTKEGNKSIKELKKGTAINELESLRIDLQTVKDELGMLDMAESEIRKLGQVEAKEKLFKKDYVEIKKDTFEDLKNMAKNYYKSNEILHENNRELRYKTYELENKVEELTDEISEKDKKLDEMFLDSLKEKSKSKNIIMDLEKRNDKLQKYKNAFEKLPKDIQERIIPKKKHKDKSHDLER